MQGIAVVVTVTLVLISLFFYQRSQSDMEAFLTVIFAAVSGYIGLVAIIQKSIQVSSQEKMDKEHRKQVAIEKLEESYFEQTYLYHKSVNQLYYKKNFWERPRRGMQVITYLAGLNKLPENEDAEFRKVALAADLDACMVHLYAICQRIRVATMEEKSRYMELLKNELTAEEKFVCGKYRFIRYKLWEREKLPQNVMDEIVEYKPIMNCKEDGPDESMRGSEAEKMDSPYAEILRVLKSYFFSFVSPCGCIASSPFWKRQAVLMVVFFVATLAYSVGGILLHKTTDCVSSPELRAALALNATSLPNMAAIGAGEAMAKSLSSVLPQGAAWAAICGIVLKLLSELVLLLATWSGLALAIRRLRDTRYGLWLMPACVLWWLLAASFALTFWVDVCLPKMVGGWKSMLVWGWQHKVVLMLMGLAACHLVYCWPGRRRE